MNQYKQRVIESVPFFLRDTQDFKIIDYPRLHDVGLFSMIKHFQVYKVVIET